MPKQVRRRDSVKKQEIVQKLRKSILTGVYKPGEQIPIQTELIKDLGVSSVTIQRALYDLQSQGFLNAKRRLGTFVSRRLPHLCDYALVFPHDPNRSVIWGNFYEALRLQALEFNRLSEKKIHFFYGVDRPDVIGDFDKLEELVRNHQLAGLIFASPPFGLTKTRILDEPDIPRVAIGTPLPDIQMPIVEFGGESCTLQSAKYLATEKIHRIAFFSTDLASVDYWLKSQYEWTDLGIITRRQWSFSIAAHLAETATACVRLLMDLPQPDRPNGIIVMDDHLTEAVERGLLTSSDSKAIETKIVASCNFPDRFVHQLPIKRIGYEAKDFIKAALEIVDMLRRGKKVRRVTSVFPHFDKAPS